MHPLLRQQSLLSTHPTRFIAQQCQQPQRGGIHGCFVPGIQQKDAGRCQFIIAQVVAIQLRCRKQADQIILWLVRVVQQSVPEQSP